MDRAIQTEKFVTRFNALNEAHKKYIMAIQQALIYAQTMEDASDKRQETRSSELIAQ